MSEPVELAPVPRLALRQPDAARAIGVSDEIFVKHVRPELAVVYLGTVRVYPLLALEEYLAHRAHVPAESFA